MFLGCMLKMERKEGQKHPQGIKWLSMNNSGERRAKSTSKVLYEFRR